MTPRKKIKNLIKTMASQMNEVFVENNIDIDTDKLEDGLAEYMTSVIETEEVPVITASATANKETLKYNQAGDLFALAYKQITANDMKQGLKTVILAFNSEDCGELVEVINQANKEADASNSSEENSSEDEIDSVIDSVIEASSDDEDTGEDEDAEDEDEDEDEEDEDEEDSDDSDDDLSDDNEEDEDEDEDEDDKMVASAEENENKDEDKDSVTDLMKKLENYPEVVASANKIALSNKDGKGKEKALEFMRVQANSLVQKNKR